MELAKGFKAYQWERNGVIISGATSATYVANLAGTYRARFSRVSNPGTHGWNQWSAPVTVTQLNPAKPAITQIGTTHLKDLNNYGNAILKSNSNADHYYWYKNGSLVNLNGNQDDTTKQATFYAGSCTGSCVGNGKYTLVTAGADGCPSPPSNPKYVFFNNQSPVTISAPITFTGQIASLTSVKLSWGDASSNEGGFEIWRRHLNGSTPSRWEMRILTAANIKTFTDTGLEPSRKYHYKIRAVSNTARSNYTPAASNAYLVITTSEDSANPSVPQSLTAKQSGINMIQVTWKASTDNTGIRQYKIYYNSKVINTNSNNTTFSLSDLTLNTNYSFTVRAEDLGGNLSSASNTASANTYVNGLYYEHTTGAWSDLDQIKWTDDPEFTGTVKNFSLAPRTQEDYFNFEFNGYLYIIKSGTYKFRTISSDGSRFELNGAILVNNDGIHSNRTITSASTTLNSGPHKINLKYFEYEETQTLTVQYYGPDTGNKWLTIPESALRSGSSSGAREAIAMSQVEEDTTSNEAVAVSLYPNPAKHDNINVAVKSTSNTPVLLTLIDFTGRKVFEKEVDITELTDGYRFTPDEQLLEGVYLLVTRQGKHSTKQRLSIKQ
jgi:hypothetical protein